MVTERLTTGLSLETGDRFIVLYGVNTSDTFSSSDLLLQDIEQALHSYFCAHNYQRIVFYSGVNKLYFLDQDSRDRCRPQTPSAASEEDSSHKPLATPGGPLGSRKGLLRKKNRQQTAASSQAPTQRMQDIQIISLLANLMEDASQSSAVVFSNAEDLAHFDNPRELWGRIVDWSRLLPDNHNCCVFVFHHETRTELQQFCQNSQFTPLANLLQNPNVSNGEKWNIERLGCPTKEEIANLQHYFRLSHKKPVDWQTLEQLSVWLSAENQSLKYWYSCFEAASELSLEQARQRDWLSGTVSTEPALQRLEAMTGLGRVKEEIRRKTRYLEVERGRREQGLSNQPPRLHLVFQGNPGTGKTTVARLIGEIYRDLGLLQRGHVVEVGGRELVAGYVGQTATKTNEIIDSAIDGVLFIDEAYTLHQEGNNNFGQEAIETLLQRMENERERLAVIIAGYPDLMDGFIQSNPGLSERFTTTVSFDDYTPEELLTIFHKQLSRVRGSISPNLETTLPSLLSQCYENRDQNFGNARFVENLFNKMDESRSLRVVENNLDRLNEPFQAEDIPEGYQFNHQEQQEDLTAVLQELNQLTGLESVKENVQEIVDEQLANQRLQEKESGKTGEVVTRHFLFTGNPGTGKTTVARLLGRIFRAMGLLRKGHFQEVNRNNLVAEYIGQTAPKTQKAIDSALDGVLFIDEAYALSSGGERDFGQEAINTLVPAMENQRERLVVILAGYSQEMKDLISSNSGLQSRISDEIHFPDYNAEELHSIFLNLCQQNGRICPPEVQQHLQQFLQTMYDYRDQNFGNGRDVRNVYEKMVKKQKKRLVRDGLSGEAMMSFAPEDIPEVL